MAEFITCRHCGLPHVRGLPVCPFTGGRVDEAPMEAGRVSATSLSPLCGQTLADKYRVDELVGQGGMGAVYAGTHLSLGRPVAIKVLLRHQAQDDRQAQRFLREARATAQIYHPNIIRVLDVGFLQDNSPYLVLEHLEGEPLEARIVRERRLLPREAVDIAIQMLDGLDEAHRTGVVHRDVKPDNVFLARSGSRIVVKILDFGLSKILDESLSTTATGAVVGTPYYISPEQATGQQTIDARVDIWAVGVCLYRMVTGHLPFDGDNVAQIALSVLRTDPTPPASHRRGLPADIENAIVRALRKAPNERWESAYAMSEALRAIDYQRRANIPDTAIDSKPPIKDTLIDAPELADTLMGVPAKNPDGDDG